MTQTSYMPQVNGMRVLPPFGLEVSFTDQTARGINLANALKTTLLGPIFSPLRNPAFFARAHLDQEGATVAWPNGADVALESLYEDFELLA